jgi:hypothetical protein
MITGVQHEAQGPASRCLMSREWAQSAERLGVAHRFRKVNECGSMGSREVRPLRRQLLGLGDGLALHVQTGRKDLRSKETGEHSSKLIKREEVMQGGTGENDRACLTRSGAFDSPRIPRGRRSKNLFNGEAARAR